MITQSTVLPLKHDEFRISYHKFENGFCLSVSRGDIQHKTPIVRFHSSCVFGESLHGLDCDCADQLNSTLKQISKYGTGVVVYQYDEGRGIGLEAKIQALELQRTSNLDSVEAFQALGFPPDLRDFDIPLQALRDLKIKPTIIVASQNPRKLEAIKKAGFVVKKVIAPQVRITAYNKPELLTKKYKLGYDISDL